jgi:NAD(P)-dependent dehydrogenase (short-subunit alcohol dehydrogenase family)
MHAPAMPFAEGRLAGRTALVTGATRGIGRTIAAWLAAAGAALYVSATRDEDVAATVRYLRAAGVTAAGVAADLSTPEGAHALGRRALEAGGRVDILVNNAGMSTRGPSWTVADADWSYQLNVNLSAPFILGQYATRDMLERGQGGRIVNISTVGAQHAFRDAAAYNAAKAGIEALTRQHATELGPYGITVNAVAPGAVMDRPGAEDEPDLRRRFEAMLPIGRVGRSEDVAAAVLFFCLPEAGWITGQVLTVDGGQTAYFSDGLAFTHAGDR